MKILIKWSEDRSIEINSDENDEIIEFLRFILKNHIPYYGYKKIVEEYLKEYCNLEMDALSKQLEQ